MTINGLTAVKSESCMLVHVQASGQEITLLNIPKGGNRDLMHTLISDLTNKLRNIVIKTSGSGTSISVTISNYDNLKSKSDKIALFLFGNGNGLSRCAIISINISGEDIIIDATTNVVSENISCSASKNVITINGLPQWGFYTVIAPPNVYIDQGGIIFDN